MIDFVEAKKSGVSNNFKQTVRTNKLKIAVNVEFA